MRDCWERSSEQAVFVSVLWDIPGITMPVFGLQLTRANLKCLVGDDTPVWEPVSNLVALNTSQKICIHQQNNVGISLH